MIRNVHNTRVSKPWAQSTGNLGFESIPVGSSYRDNGEIPIFGGDDLCLRFVHGSKLTVA